MTKLGWIAMAVAAVLLLGACGGDDSGGDVAENGGVEVEVEVAGDDGAREPGGEDGGAEDGADDGAEEGSADAGTSGEGGDDPIAVVVTHLRATAEGDGQRACAVLSPAGLEQFERELQAFGSDESCVDFIDSLSEFNPDGETVIGGEVVTADELASVAFTVEIEGDRAEVSAPGEAEPAVLERIDGKWLIASIPDGEAN